MDDRPGTGSEIAWSSCSGSGSGSSPFPFLKGVVEGHFREDADPDQFAQDLYGIMLGFHHASRLLQDPAAEPPCAKVF
jgi:hypothetical protein